MKPGPIRAHPRARARPRPGSRDRMLDDMTPGGHNRMLAAGRWLTQPLAALVLCTLACMPAAAQTVPKIPFEKYTLDNGLEVILAPDHSTPVVAVNTWYHVGSADEAPGRTGFAHLFEHIMFMGSEHVPVGKFDSWLEAAGASNNGSTMQDRTNYYEWMPSNALPLALWLDGDRMGYLLPTMDQAKVDLQRDVVKNERRQRVDNVPYGRSNEIIMAALFPATHPYHHSVIGSMADLSAASLDDVRHFFETYYAPNNATLAIAGDFDTDSVKSWVERYFGGIPRNADIPPRPAVPSFAIPRDTFMVLEDRVQLPRLYQSWHTVKAFADDDAALDVLAFVLANGKNSRLYKRLVYDMQVAQDVRAVQVSMRLDGYFQIVVTPRPGQSPSRMASLVREEIARIATSGIEPRELERARNSILANQIDQLASVLGKSDRLNYYNYFVGTPDYAGEDAERFRRVTVPDVRRVSSTYLEAPSVVLTVVPEGKTDMMVTAARGGR